MDVLVFFLHASTMPCSTWYWGDPKVGFLHAQDMGWELLRRKRALMKLGYSDVYSFRGAHRE